MDNRNMRMITILAVLAVGAGCAGLIPTQKQYRVLAEPVLPERRGNMYVDLEDSSVVFSKEGAIIKVRLLSDAELNERFPLAMDGRFVNPYSYAEADPALGYVPPRFTVFDVTVVNETYAKILFDPAKAVLITDKREEFRYYDGGREAADLLGGNSFNRYYGLESGRSGNELKLNMERRGLINKTVYHRHRFVFKGDRRTGLLVFDPLTANTRQIRLLVKDFVLAFDANGNPEEMVDVEFVFDIEQRVVEAAESGGV